MESLDFLFHIPSGHGNRIAEEGYEEANPLGGSETSLIRLAAALRELGHRTRIETDVFALAGTRADVFISCRAWHPLFKCPVAARLRYYWAQDDSDQPLVAQLEDAGIASRFYAVCHGVALVSKYQFDRWSERLHLPAQKAFFGLNGIARDSIAAPLDAEAPRPRRAYYASHPARGLAPLLMAWPQIKAAIPDAELAVMGSAGLYRQKASAEEVALFEKAASLPGVSVLGAVGQRRLREEARRCRVLAYPNTFPETSCVTAMEAMAAGCAVVAPARGALPETAWRNPLVWPAEDWLAQWTVEAGRILADDDYYHEIGTRNLALARFLGYRDIAHAWLRRIEIDAAVAAG